MWNIFSESITETNRVTWSKSLLCRRSSVSYLGQWNNVTAFCQKHKLKIFHYYFASALLTFTSLCPLPTPNLPR